MAKQTSPMRRWRRIFFIMVRLDLVPSAESIRVQKVNSIVCWNAFEKAKGVRRCYRHSDQGETLSSPLELISGVEEVPF